MRKWQRYEIINDYVIIYTSKNEPFYVDLVDFDKVYRYSWYKDKDGYLIAKINKKSIKLHRYITDCPPNMIVDHIGGALTRNDNRRKILELRHNNSILKTTLFYRITLLDIMECLLIRKQANGEYIYT